MNNASSDDVITVPDGIDAVYDGASVVVTDLQSSTWNFEGTSSFTYSKSPGSLRDFTMNFEDSSTFHVTAGNCQVGNASTINYNSSATSVSPDGYKAMSASAVLNMYSGVLQLGYYRLNNDPGTVNMLGGDLQVDALVHNAGDPIIDFDAMADSTLIYTDAATETDLDPYLTIDGETEAASPKEFKRVYESGTLTITIAPPKGTVIIIR